MKPQLSHPTDADLIEAAICLTDSALALKGRIKELQARHEVTEAASALDRLNSLLKVNALIIDMATKLQTDQDGLIQ